MFVWVPLPLPRYTGSDEPHMREYYIDIKKVSKSEGEVLKHSTRAKSDGGEEALKVLKDQFREQQKVWNIHMYELFTFSRISGNCMLFFVLSLGVLFPNPRTSMSLQPLLVVPLLLFMMMMVMQSWS